MHRYVMLVWLFAVAAFAPVRGQIGEEMPICFEGLLNPTFYSEWFTSVDLLYWRVREEGLRFESNAFKENSYSAYSSQAASKRPSKEMPHDFHTGFRFGIGGANRLAGWATEMYWTHLEGTSSAKIDSQNRSHWQFNFNTLDFQLNRIFYLNRLLEVKVFLGVEAGWIHQKRKIKLLDQLWTSETTFFKQSTRKDTSSYQGIGPRLGAAFDWYLCRGFSLYANGAAAVWFGKFNLHHRLNDEKREFYASFYSESDLKRDSIFGNRYRDSSTLSSRKHRYNSQYLIDVSAGLQWHGLVYDELDLYVMLGYEYYRIFNQNKVGGSGDLIFDGVTLSASLSI